MEKQKLTLKILLLNVVQKAYEFTDKKGQEKAGVTYRANFSCDGQIYEARTTEVVYNALKDITEKRGVATFNLDVYNRVVRLNLLGFS